MRKRAAGAQVDMTVDFPIEPQFKLCDIIKGWTDYIIIWVFYFIIVFTEHANAKSHSEIGIEHFVAIYPNR